MYFFLTIKDFWLLNINNQKVQHYRVFALLADWVTLALLFFCLLAFAAEDIAFSNSLCCLSVNSFLFCPIFSKLCIAWSRLVLAVSSIIVATLTVCLLTAVAERASCIVLMLHHSLIHQPLSSLLLLLLPLALEYVSALSSGDGRDLVISSLASRILSATFCSASTLFLSSSNFSAFSRAWNEVWVDHTDLFRSTLLWFPGWPLPGFSTNFHVDGKHLKQVKKKVFNIPFRKRGSPCRWSR